MQIGMIPLKTKYKTKWTCPILAAGCFLLVCAWFSSAAAGIDSAPLSTWFVDMNQYAGSAHGTLECDVCHGFTTGKGNLIGKTHPDPEAVDLFKSQAKRDFNYQACQKCHKIAYERFGKGEHAIAAAKEKETRSPSKTGYAPTCGDCHSSHYSKSHKSRAQIGKEMTETCGTCHVSQKKSFLANYHGKTAVNLGYEKAAFCTDCHGAHTTASLKEKTAALTACRRCHPDATPEFANIIIHDSTKNPDLKNDTKKSGLKWVHIMAALSLTLVVTVLSFFYMHTGLLILRKLHEKLRRHK